MNLSLQVRSRRGSDLPSVSILSGGMLGSGNEWDEQFIQLAHYEDDSLLGLGDVPLSHITSEFTFEAAEGVKESPVISPPSLEVDLGEGASLVSQVIEGLSQLKDHTEDSGNKSLELSISDSLTSAGVQVSLLDKG